MLKFSKKTFFFLFYFIKVLHFYIKGLLISKNKVIFSIMRANLIPIVTFLKYNLIAGSSSLLDIVVVDNINYNHNRFELTYIFWNIYYSYRLGIKLYTTQLNGITSISNFYENAN